MALPVAPMNGRLYVGGLGEQVTRQDMEELFKDYEPYVDLNLLRGYGFVQFYSEEDANKAIEGLNGKTLNGRTLTVKIANDNRGKKGVPPRGDARSGVPPNAVGRDRSPIDPNRYVQEGYPPRGPYQGIYAGLDVGGYPPMTMMGASQPMQPVQPESNDCEIIVVSRDLTVYAEGIESRLKRNGLSVDLLFPNDDVPIGKVLSNIASRGSYYAILITPENEERNSITVNVLYGIPAEHRNMPTDDAISFICKDFEKVRAEKEKAKYRAPNNAPMVYNTPSLQDKHPEPIQNMINLLAANRQLTVLQYDRLIKYLTERKEMQIRYELGEDIDASATASLLPSKSKADSEKELQKKILSILNKPSIVPPKHPAPEPEKETRTVPAFGSAVAASMSSLSAASSISASNPIAGAAPKLLHDPKVQKALDSLLMSGLGGGLKF